MSSLTDFLKLSEHKIVQNVRDRLAKDLKKTQNIMCIQEDMLYMWDFLDSCVLTLNVKAARSRDGDNVIHQTLLPMSPPLFTPEHVLVNESNTLLIVYGPNGALVFELPARSPPYGCFSNNKEVIYCRSYSLHERTLAFSNHIVLRQVRFHPGSLRETHVTMLTSDNIIRIYNIENAKAIPVGTYGVGIQPMGRLPSNVSFLEVFGETAVDFDFGPPENNQTPIKCDPDILQNTQMLASYKANISKTANIQEHFKSLKITNKSHDLEWPIYVLYGTGEVYITTIILGEKGSPHLKGPLQSFPSNASDFGNDCCAIICIPSTPPMLSIAKCNGNILHSLILDNPNEELDRTSRKKIEDVPKNLQPSNKIMCVIENIELELGLATTHEAIEYSCPIYLYRDPSLLGCYFATHETGVHSITIPYIDNLHKFINANEEEDELLNVIDNSSTAEYLICTKTATSEQINPVIGFSLYHEPSSVMALLGNGQFVSLAILRASSMQMQEDYALDNLETMNSPLKKMLSNRFDEHIQRILKQSSTQPILKLSTHASTQQEAYELLQRASQVFREEHFKQHDKAREEIEKRVKALKMLKNFQCNEILRMSNDKAELQEKAEFLAEKYEDSKDKQEDLNRRCEKLLILISKRQTVPSNAEKIYLQELTDTNAKLVKYASAIGKLKNKIKYQDVQMQNWVAQSKKKTGLGTVQSDSIKANLQDMTNKITNMIKEVNHHKKHLNIQ